MAQKLSLSTSHMDYEPSNRRLLLWSIVAALAVWGGLLALGAYLGLDPQTPDRDFRRLWVVAATTSAFLALWLGALLFRRRG
jgi:membrane protein DedA with SNARE-associated domain